MDGTSQYTSGTIQSGQLKRLQDAHITGPDGVEHDASRILEEFVAITVGLKGLWNQFTEGTLSPTVSGDVCQAMEKAESLLTQCIGSEIFEVLCFSEATSHFFPLVAAMSISPIPTVQSQLAALQLLKVLIASASNASPSSAALTAKLFQAHKVVQGFLLALRSAQESDEQAVLTSVVEACFVAVTTNTQISQQFLCSESLQGFVAFIPLCYRSKMHHALYFLVTFFRTLTVDENRDHAAMILASANLHLELYQLVVVAGRETESMATIVGLSLQVLSVLLENCASSFGEMLADPALAGILIDLLSSKWSEVLCGSCVLIKALLNVAPVKSVAVGALIASDLHESLLLLIDSTTIHVAANAASALRTYVLRAKPLIAGRKMMCSPHSVHSLLTVLLDESLNVATSNRGGHAQGTVDRPENRIVRTECALTLAVFLCAAPSHRELLAQKLRNHFDPSSLAILRHNTFVAVTDYHPSIYTQWPIEDLVGSAVCRQWVEEGMAPRSARAIFHSQEDVARVAVPAAQRNVVAAGGAMAEDPHQEGIAGVGISGSVLGSLLGSQLERGLFVQQLMHEALEVTFSIAAAPHMGAGQRQLVGALPVGDSEGCDKALKLILQLSRWYGKTPTSTAKRAVKVNSLNKSVMASSTDRLKPIKKETNSWEAKSQHNFVQEHARKWSIDVIEKKDLFTFSLHGPDWIEGVAEARIQCTNHLMALRTAIKCCPTSWIQRRTLLTDLYENVFPKLNLCFKFLQALLQRPDGNATLQAVLSERGQHCVDAGNIHDLYVALASS